MTAGLVGKTALITGAGRGIGAAIATGVIRDLGQTVTA
jgi:NAD(P)-dependent dehydrogenase (short-subunit alcohol dehydrogenase family)